jgi:uncharacterized membrane protein
VISLFVLLGVTVGMRTMTAIAVLCWFAWSRMLPQTGWAAWTAYLVSAIVFTFAALGEYIGDTLPKTPSRTAPGPMIARLVFGGLVGGLAAHGILEPTVGGVLFGCVGALIGTYGGYYARKYAAQRVGHDLPVALLESALALGVALFLAVKLHSYAAVLGLTPRGRWML